MKAIHLAPECCYCIINPASSFGYVVLVVVDESHEYRALRSINFQISTIRNCKPVTLKDRDAMWFVVSHAAKRCGGLVSLLVWHGMIFVSHFNFNLVTL